MSIFDGLGVATVSYPKGNCKHDVPFWTVCIQCGRLIGSASVRTTERASQTDRAGEQGNNGRVGAPTE